MNPTNENNPPPLQIDPEIENIKNAVPLEADASMSTVFESLLKTPHHLIRSFLDLEKPGGIVMKLVVLSLSGFVIFGLTLGSFSLGDQLWAAPMKTIMGVIFSAVICLPSLYVFSALTGTSLKFHDIARGLAATLALIAALLLGFTPVLWVFSQSTESEAFFGLLVIVSWITALLFGMGFFTRMLRHSGTKKKGPVKIWIGIFLLVTLQMSTTLRPIIGTSDHLFTTEKRFFLIHWMSQAAGTNLDERTKADQLIEETLPQVESR